MYVNIVANMVCVSLCYRSHGEGEDPTVSSPTEPVGRRQDPMGHLPLWQEYVAETNTKNYENLFEKSDTAFPVGPYQFVFGSHRQNSQGLVSCAYQTMAHQKEVQVNTNHYICKS